jgi:hypothetical protein
LSPHCPRFVPAALSAAIPRRCWVSVVCPRCPRGFAGVAGEGRRAGASSGRPLGEFDHVCTLAQLVQVVRPCGHHGPALFQIGRVVVRRHRGVSLLVRKLQLYDVMRVALFVQDGRSHTPETVPSHAARVTHAFQRGQYGVVAHRLFVVTLAREQQRTAPGHRFQRLQHFHRLRGQRHDV